MRRSTVGLLLVLCLLALDAGAGTISGRVQLGRASARGQGDAGVADAVVWVERVPDKVEAKLAGGSGWWIFRHAADTRPQRIVQADARFRPRVLATVAGHDVEFRNLDRVYHNVFSVSSARRFDTGKTAPGHADTIAFRRSGVVNVLCDVHPQEVAYVVVVPNHVMARPDSLGRYELPRLPEGDYVVHAWHPRCGELRRDASMPRKGDITLDLRF